jgi:anhydro-N-acetylmuramic acid kinase
MVSSKLIVGLMSGTSLDGIDAVLLRVWGSGVQTKFKQLAFVHRSFPQGLQRLLLKSSDPATSRVDDIARLNMLLAQLYADAVRAVARRGRVELSQIGLIGSHGQTIQHLPNPVRLFRKTVRATFQIGDPSALVALTGIPTVGDFRVADMAVSGQGAPLVPYFDWLVFRSKTKNRLLLNIGGIANVTVLSKNCSIDRVRAFDTGPGNMVIDGLMQNLYGKPFDRDGKIARKSMIVLDLFRWMKSRPYLRRSPPKSTGREMFGETFVNEILKRGKRYEREDIIATVSAFTPFAVHDACKRFVEKQMTVDDVIVSGGGAHNTFFIDELRRYFGRNSVRLIDEFGIPTSAKEAICFAILANETMAGHPTNIPGVTGARRAVVLGKICKP